MPTKIPYALLVTDMDGTLFNPQSVISERNKSALQRFENEGGLVSIATGRMEAAVTETIDTLDLHVPIILYNGCRIYDPVAKTVLMEKTLPNEETLDMISLLESAGEAFIVYSGANCYVNTVTPAVQKHFDKENIPFSLLNDEDFPLPVTKILVIDPTRTFAAKQSILYRYPNLNTVFSELSYWEILPDGADKGTGLEFLLSYLHLSPEQCIAFGDQRNDLPLLQTAGMGVAMGNAHDELKSVAQRIAPSNADDGLAVILEELIQNGKL